MNWRTVPLLRPLLFLIVGILIGSHYPFLSIPILLLASTFVLLLLFISQKNGLPYEFRKYIGIVISIAFLLAGYTLSSGISPSLNPNHLIHYEEGQITAVATVQSNPSVKNKVQVQLKLISRGEQNKAVKTSGKILAFFAVDDRSLELIQGDKIYFKAKLNRTQSNSNPYSFDFKKYYANKGIYQQAHILDWKYIERGSPILRRIGQMRGQLLGILAKHLTSENEYAVGAALCLGSKETLNDEIKNEYAGTGAMHVLAISGLHVGIIFNFLYAFLSLFKTRKPAWLLAKVLVTILLLWIYALFTGASPSVLRAALMFSFITISIYYRSNLETYNTLAAAAIALLIYDPNLLYDVGFQLSFTAVAGIVYFQPRIYASLYVKNKILDYLWQITAVGIAAQLATFPIGIYYFHSLPTLFILTGLFVVPFAYIILITSLALFTFSAFSEVIADFIGNCLYGLIWINNALIHLIFEWSAHLNQYFTISLVGLGLLYLLIFLVDKFIKEGSFRVLAASLSIVLMIALYGVVNNQVQPKSGYFCVYQINKGSLIDITFQDQRRTISDLDPESKKVKYTTENLRENFGVTETNNKGKTQSHYGQIYLAGDKSVAILKDDFLPSKKVDVDWVVLSDETIELQSLIAAFEFDTLVMDGTLSKSVREKWKTYLHDRGIAYHDVKDEGAFYMVF